MNIKASRGLVLWAAAAVVVASGCGSGSPATGAGAADAARDVASDAGAPEAGVDAQNVAVDQFGQAYVATLCARVYDCCPANLRAAVTQYGTDVASCRDQLALAAGQLSAEFSEEVSMGRAAYDGVQMAQCLHNLVTESCDTVRAVYDYTSTDPTCEAGLRAKVALGGTCVADEGCINGWCDASNAFVCVVRKPDGQVCDRDVQCQSDICDNTGSGVCVASRPDGLCMPNF